MKHGSCDQAQWNELHLRARFLQKSYGILGDGGFTFNRTTDTERINGWKPHKRKKGVPLTDEEKKENLWISQSRVVIENVIGQLKKWKVLAGKYKHYKVGKKSRIELNNVILACALLTENRLCQNPLRPPWWRPKSINPMDVSTLCN